MFNRKVDVGRVLGLVRQMLSPGVSNPVADEAPNAYQITPYDQRHFITYARLLDADRDGADWREIAKIILYINPRKEPGRARRAYETHLARARWISTDGYRELLRDAVDYRGD